MRRLEKIGMKLTKYFLILIIANFSLATKANDILLDYFKRVYMEEKNNFLACVHAENLSTINRIYTNCEITALLKEAAYILNNKKDITSFDLIEDFQKYKKISSPIPGYPNIMQKKGEMGFVVVSFDISDKGNTENHKIVNGYCGDVYNPQTKFIECDFFNPSALRAAKKLKYHPSQFEGKSIRTNDVRHRFTYAMQPASNIQINKKTKEYKKLINALEENNFELGLEIANENISFDPYFAYQKAAINFYMENYTDSIEAFKDLSIKIQEQNKEIKEEYYVTSFSMLINALFNTGKYEDIIELEENYNDYLIERPKYQNLLAMTNFFIGATFINTGNIHKGAFYMTLASRSASSKAQSDYFDSYINKLASYL